MVISKVAIIIHEVVHNDLMVSGRFKKIFSTTTMILTTSTTTITVIIITRPKPAYGRQGLAGSWGQDTDEVSNFLVFLTSHFAPAALSSDLNQPGTINGDKNPPGIMKTRPGAIKTNL